MRGHCSRCGAHIEPYYQYPKMRFVARGYLLAPLPFIPVLPIMAADYVVCLPLLMVYLLGLGPAFAIIKDPPTCPDCGAMVEFEVRRTKPVQP
jgi:hypothetical protein